MTNSILAKPATVLLIALAGVVVSGLLVFQGLSTQGHAAFNTNNLGISWGLAIVVYDYFLLTSTGLAMVATLAILFGGDTWAPVVKRCLWLALAGLAGGVAVLMLELGHPLRALWAIPTSLQVASPLFWKVLFVAAYVLLLLLLFARVRRAGGTADGARPLAVALLLVALGLTGLAGSVYGTMSMRSFWSSGDVPVAFIVESLLGGVAFMVFFSYLAYGLSQDGMPDELRRLINGPVPTALSLAIVFHGMFVLARTSIGLWSNAEGHEVWWHLIRSPLFHVEVWVGLALPLFLMVHPRLRSEGRMQVAAAFLVMVSLFISRYDYIMGGQLVPLFKGAWAPDLLHYAPSFTEWMLLLLAIFLANVVNAFGERVLGLSSGTPSQA
jgi:molybdopterin-containing oxidoreductase family membrane subunit